MQKINSMGESDKGDTANKNRIGKIAQIKIGSRETVEESERSIEKVKGKLR